MIEEKSVHHGVSSLPGAFLARAVRFFVLQKPLGEDFLLPQERFADVDMPLPVRVLNNTR